MLMPISPPFISLLNRTPGFVARWFRSEARTSRLLRPAINTVLPDRAVVAQVRSGVGTGLRLPIHARSEKYYWTGLHERHVQSQLVELLRPGMVFWDVGAHIGFFSLVAGRLVTPNGSVEAFEPFPPNQIRLATSVQLNRTTNITVHPVALSACSGVAAFHPTGSSLMGSLIPQDRTSITHVKCMSADDAAETIRRPDVVKIDAEGAEIEVIRGAQRLLTSARPRVLIELTNNRMIDELRELMPLYRAVNIGSNHWLLEPR
jgi:FkbM family methyltransferase